MNAYTLTCSRCGFTTSKSGVITMDAKGDHCLSARACKRRRDQRPQYRDWTNPSFEQQMST